MIVFYVGLIEIKDFRMIYISNGYMLKKEIKRFYLFFWEENIIL